MSRIQMNTGEIIAFHRKRAGYTSRSALAKATDGALSLPQVRDVELGVRTLRVEEMIALCAVLPGLTIDALVEASKVTA